MKQGGQPDIEDLDGLIASRSLKPKQIRFGGREWTLKRDFTPAQVVEFWATVDHDLPGGMAMLVGDEDGVALASIVRVLPTEMATMPLRRIYQIAGVLHRVDDKEGSEGESSASSQES